MKSQDTQQQLTYQTRCGLHVERTSEVIEQTAVPGSASPPAIRDWGSPALRTLTEALDRRRGLLLTSTFEYPGRYRKKAVGFVDPPLMLSSRGETFTLDALQARGELLLDALLPTLSDHPDFVLQTRTASALSGRIHAATDPSCEELRTRRPSVLSVVRALCAALGHERDPLLGLYGAFGYDLVFQFETLRRARRGDPRAERELVLYVPDQLLVREEATGATTLYRYEFRLDQRTTKGIARAVHEASFFGSSPPADSEAGTESKAQRADSDHATGEFEGAVELAKQAFRRGDLFEVTLSQTFCRPYTGSPSALFAELTASNPSPYGFLVNLGAGELLVGASPEMYVRVTGNTVETCPIAGTTARGSDALGDARQIQDLLNSEKDQAELTMCTDVDRNDKARVCEPGSVRVIGRRQIELYSRLIHTVDHVQGTLRAGYDAIDALLTHMWAVTVTGAPKLDAMQFIEDHEKSARGYYGAAVGAVLFDGSLDTGLTLRSIHLTHGRALVRAGATLVFDSDPAAERRESELKASALLHALARAASRKSDRLDATTTAPKAVPAESARSALPAPHVEEPLRVLLIDHRDSFVHTLADYFRQADCQVTTLRYGFEERAYDRLAPELVVLSPGPMRPDDFALRTTLAILERRKLPVFGVCLGLQAMVEYAGGALRTLDVPVHGKPSELRIVAEHALFQGLPARFPVGRYHSLSADPQHFPSALCRLAESEDGTVMALAHRTLPWCAVQFHPESILTAGDDRGLGLIRNVVSLARASRPVTSVGRGD